MTNLMPFAASASPLTRDRKYRVLLISSHPVPNAAPVLRRLAQHPSLEILVAYCTLPDSRLWGSAEYITKMAFDVPLLDGYPWAHVPNRSPVANLAKFFGLFNPGLIPLIQQFECSIVFGYNYASLALAVLATRLMNRPLIISTDATSMESSGAAGWRARLKPRLLPKILGLADVVIVPSTASKTFLHSLGLSPERVVITPYVVDNDYVAMRAISANPEKRKQEWGIPADAAIVLFCAKFLPRKRPLDVVRAFARANVQGSYLVIVGDGPLREAVQAECETLGIVDRVRVLGLVNYSELPEVYAACDLLVVPSSHEPWGLPVNEAMLCGRPVVVSDRVGARYDLVTEGETGFVFPCGDVGALARILRRILPDQKSLQRMGEAARARMDTWSPQQNVDAFVTAVERAAGSKRGT